MKDIGSIFPLTEDEAYNTTGSSRFFDGERYYFSLCREALYVIAQVEKSPKNTKALIPAYTCDTVITPFLESGYTCDYYPVNKDLTLDVVGTKMLIDSSTYSVLVVHPYFGMDLNNEEVKLVRYAKSKGVKIVIDLTQCIFSKKNYDFADYIVGSYRKWYQVPDGGFLICRKEINIGEVLDNKYFSTMQTDAMYLRGEYFRTSNENLKRISIRLNKLAVESVDFNVTPHKMADISRELLCKIDMAHFIEQRNANYRYLQENIKNTKIELLCKDLSRLTTAPLYFIIYTKIREELQSLLCSHHIYAPIIWPVYYRDVLINKTTEEIYNETLAIPIDQRYDKSDMEKIVNILNIC